MTALYLAGPMTGYPRWNFDAFDEAARRLRDAGFVVISPADHDRRMGFDPDTDGEAQLPGFREDALRWDLSAILYGADGIAEATDGIALLPGWEASKGARLEADVATAVGMPVSTVNFWLNLAGALPLGELAVA